jgi:ABC-type lipoprotein export system ATPase subunit
MTKNEFLQFLDNSLSQVQQCKINFTTSNIDSVLDQLINHCNKLKEIIEDNNLAINYLSHFQNDVNQILMHIQNYLSQYMHYQNSAFVNMGNKHQEKNNLDNQKNDITKQMDMLKFNVDFFSKLNFFDKNIVAIGANGSGKSTLTNILKYKLYRTGIVIPAQKILNIPTINAIPNFTEANQRLQQKQQSDKTFKTPHINNELFDELGTLLNNLVAENSLTINKFYKTLSNGMRVENKPITNLDKVINIWNSLIQHRILECEDGINLTLRTSKEINGYQAYQMSDGEKDILYLVAQVLQAPSNGFIITDEPEMYLHKTILKKLWDKLEEERQDCIFIYLTHDLDFAISRTDAKKVWIKSFEYPDKWEIESIPENELPEALLLELLGSKKNILFCEGKEEGKDDKIYNCLFPNLTIKLVGGCQQVKDYTKAFNKISNRTTDALGLIDSDYHNSEILDKLKKNNIFSLSVAELENFLLDEDFLKLLAKERFMQDDKEEIVMQTINDIREEIISEFKKNIEIQVSNYVSTKIGNYFKNTDIKKGNSLEDIKINYDKLHQEIKIDEWHKERKKELEEVILAKNYDRILSICNNKGLKRVVEKYFKTSDFTDKAIKFLQSNGDARNILLKYFPKELKATLT